MVATLLPQTVRSTNRRSPNCSWDSCNAPLGFNAGDTNLNRYVGNSPTNYTEPNGPLQIICPQACHRKRPQRFWTFSECHQHRHDNERHQDDGATYNGGPFADPLNHGDDNRIKETIERINEYLDAAEKGGTPAEVFKEFGKALHAMQDLYSHSTYIEWQDKRAGGKSKKGTIPTWKMCDQDGMPLIPGHTQLNVWCVQ